MPSNYDDAFREWRNFLSDRVLSEDDARKKYEENTIAFTLPIAGALLPQSTDEVCKIVKIAAQYQISLYPISTGHNWGYGGSTPSSKHAVILDLSSMKKIRDMQNELGLVTVEPGVTQGQLHQYLETNNLNFQVPVTGAGPTCSLVGNALDRGYGLNPYADHFAAVTAVEAVLPNGEIYRAPFAEMGGDLIDKAYKWGIGPYINGLYFQGNLAIITALTIILAPKPEHFEGLIFYLDSDEDLLSLIHPLRETLQSIGMNMGTLKITNQHRLLNILEFFPEKKGSPEILLLNDDLDKKLKSKYIPNYKWLGTTAIYGNKKMVSAVRKIIKQKLKNHVKHLTFINPVSLSRLERILQYIPIIKSKPHLLQLFKKLNELLSLLSGHPNEIGLPIAYAKSGIMGNSGVNLNPDKDGCGIIWFAPLVPMLTKDVETYLHLVQKIFVSYNIEPIITFSALSDHCIDSTVPILFNRNDADSIKKAHECYQTLFKECQRHGYLPYRMPVNFMDLIINKESLHWQLLRSIKNTIDPNNIISPGRYSL